MTYTVTTRQVPKSLTAVVAQKTTWEEFPRVWRPMLDRVYTFLKATDRLPAGQNIMFYKDDVPNVEVGVKVTAPFSPGGSVVPSSLPSGEVATTVHRGPYQALGAAHRAVREWCAAEGRSIAGPRWEIYGDWCENPADLETEVCYLLQPPSS